MARNLSNQLCLGCHDAGVITVEEVGGLKTVVECPWCTKSKIIDKDTTNHDVQRRRRPAKPNPE